MAGPLTSKAEQSYEPVKKDHDNDNDSESELGKEDEPEQPLLFPEKNEITIQERPVRRHTIRTVIITLMACAAIALGAQLAASYGAFTAITGQKDDECPCRPSDVPQYFQTSPELWAGPTATGKAAFLAQTRTFDPTGYVPNGPLQTSIPVQGMAPDDSIFRHMGCVDVTQSVCLMIC
jgi:hypothetical protein